MLSEKLSTELAQAYSLGQAVSPTVGARLEPASYRDLRALADGYESSSRSPGLQEAERVQLLIQANHARLVAVKTNPHKSKKAKRSSVSRLRRRIERLHCQQQDVGFCPSGFRVGSHSRSQHDLGDLSPGSSPSLSRAREGSI